VKRACRGQRETLLPFQRLLGRAMLFLDGPEHTRVRQVLGGHFRQPALRRIASHIEQCVAELQNAVEHAPEFDFIESFAKPLPARVIARLLGIDVGQRPEFIGWSDDLADFIGSIAPSAALTMRAKDSLLAMSAFFDAHLAEIRQRGANGDLVSDLLLAANEERIEAGAELLAQCAMLLFAGHETTRNLLGNGLHALLRHPYQWSRVQEDPTLLPNSIKELLRYESPVQYTGRRIAETHELHGRELKRGQLVIALIGAANRDPIRYAEPDRLDVMRREGANLSFGHGPHVCIGAALTMMEAEIAFRAVLSRWPRLALVDAPPRWNGNPVYRGMKQLLVRKN
jgi:cytochrome P450